MDEKDKERKELTDAEAKDILERGQSIMKAARNWMDGKDKEMIQREIAYSHAAVSALAESTANQLGLLGMMLFPQEPMIDYAYGLIAIGLYIAHTGAANPDHGIPPAFKVIDKEEKR